MTLCRNYFSCRGPDGEAERESESCRALVGLGLSGLRAFSPALQGRWWLIRSN